MLASVLQPAQTWLASNIASDLRVGTPRPLRRHNIKVTTVLSY